MTLRIDRIEIFLIAAGLLVAFGYIAFRAVIWDSFAWIVAVPLAASLFLVAVSPRYLRIRPNTLDRLVVAYFIYGFGLAAIGILFLDSSKYLVIKGLVHYYAPVVFYFIARRYTYNSPDKTLVITRIIWVLAVIFVIDFFAENYIVRHLGSGSAIPWVKNELSKMPDITATVLNRYSYERVSTVLVGGKRPGFMAAALFVTILPFLLHEVRRHRSAWSFRTWQFNTLLNAAVLSGLGFAALRLNNKTALVAAVLVLIIGLLSLRSIRKITTISVLLAIGLFFAYGTIADIVQTQFFTTHRYEGSSSTQDLTPFEYIVRPEYIGDAYRNADPYSFFFGAQLINSNSKTSDLQLITPDSLSSSELRGTGLPIFFGFGWALIVGAILSTMLLYSFRLIRSAQFRFFGLAIIGLVVVYAGDLHYPSSMTHGPIEILVVMTGVLSSLYDTSRKPSDAEVRTVAHGPSRGHLKHPSSGRAATSRLRPRPTETI